MWNDLKYTNLTLEVLKKKTPNFALFLKCPHVKDIKSVCKVLKVQSPLDFKIIHYLLLLDTTGSYSSVFIDLHDFYQL